MGQCHHSSSNMKTAALVLAFALGASADSLGSHNHQHSARRSGRQDAPGSTYSAAPLGGYEADLDTAASDALADPLAMLQSAIPGIPGEDYPIYSEVPESAFACDGQVDGGYYADPAAECQAFHICTADGAGGLAKYSFLCPNGTLVNQNYFICDWWFNFDCSTAEDLYSLNDDIAAEREAIDAAAGEVGAASDAVQSYNAPLPADYSYDEYVAPEEDEDVAVPADEYPAYDDVTDALSGYAAEETTLAPLAPAAEGYLPPAEEARRGRSGGRSNGRGQGRRNGRQNGRRGNNRRNQRRPSQRNGRRNFRG